MKFIAFTAAASLLLSTAARADVVKVPEGTEFPIRIEEKLSSKTSAEGDRFTISLEDDVKLADGTILHAGYTGAGEVTVANKNGRIGKGGELSIRLNYLRVGDQRIRLRASQGKNGKDAVGSTIALTVLFGPLGLLKKGKNIEIQKGQVITAFADDNTELASPVAAPPPKS